MSSIKLCGDSAALLSVKRQNDDFLASELDLQIISSQSIAFGQININHCPERIACVAWHLPKLIQEEKKADWE